MKILKLSDRDLSKLLLDARNEAKRRVKEAAVDAGTIIWGQEMAKRALTVAAAGSHSILFVGPPGCGKTMLRAAGLLLGVEESYEARFCPCGYYQDSHAPCTCTAKAIEKHVHKWPITDISIEVPRVPFRDCNPRLKGTGLADMKANVARFQAVNGPINDESCRNLMRAAVAELGLTVQDQDSIQNVARTIAGLDQAKYVEARHLCEAINYRSLRRIV